MPFVNSTPNSTILLLVGFVVAPEKSVLIFAFQLPITASTLSEVD